MRDWIGDGNSVFKTLGASNHSKSDRHSEDYYATDPKAIDALIKVYNLPNQIWECACGEGHLAKRLTELGYDVVSTDLVDRGYGIGGVDFLCEMDNRGCDCILTNPPYKCAADFVLHALDIIPAGGVVVMFLKTTFLEGQMRYNKLFSKYPPRYIFQFVKRILCALNGDFEKQREIGSAVSYCWMIWEKGYKGETIIKWI